MAEGEIDTDPKEELRRLATLCARAKVHVKVKGLVNGVWVEMEARGKNDSAVSGISYNGKAEVDEDKAYRQLLPLFKQQMEKVLKKRERTTRKLRFKI